MPADGGQLRTGGVRQFILPYNGVGNSILQKAVWGQGVEQVRDGGLLLPSSILTGGAGGPQDGGYLQQLPCIQAAPHIRPLETGRHRTDPGKPWGAPEDQQLHSGRGLLLGPAHILYIGHRTQGEGSLPPLVGDGATGQHFQHPGQL